MTVNVKFINGGSRYVYDATAFHRDGDTFYVATPTKTYLFPMRNIIEIETDKFEVSL